MSEQAEQTKRAVAYIRESTEEQGRGYSPDGQRQAIARYAADHGMRLVEEYLDFETGRLARQAAGVSAADRGRDGAPLRGRARLPHLPVRAQHGRGQALQEAPALRARDRRDLRHPAARRRRRRPRRVPLGVRARDLRRVLLRLAVLLDEDGAAREGPHRASSPARSPGGTSRARTRSPPPTPRRPRTSAGCSRCTRPACTPTAPSPPG